MFQMVEKTPLILFSLGNRKIKLFKFQLFPFNSQYLGNWLILKKIKHKSYKLKFKINFYKRNEVHLLNNSNFFQSNSPQIAMRYADQTSFIAYSAYCFTANMEQSLLVCYSISLGHRTVKNSICFNHVVNSQQTWNIS